MHGQHALTSLEDLFTHVMQSVMCLILDDLDLAQNENFHTKRETSSDV
jgi:hypothetical protein